MDREPAELDWEWIGARIREARERRRWTQRQLGALVGLSQQALSAIENGKGSGYPLATYWAIREALGIPWTTLVEGQPLPPPNTAPPSSSEAQNPQAVFVSLLSSIFLW